MTDTSEASEAGRALVAHRWGDSKLRGAVAVVLERASTLTAPTRTELERIAWPSGGDHADDGDR